MVATASAAMPAVRLARMRPSRRTPPKVCRDTLRRIARPILGYGFPCGVNRAGLAVSVLFCDGFVLVVASGRTSGVVKNTPSGVGFGVAVMEACGDPAT